MFCQSKTRKKQTGSGEKWGKIFFTYQVSTFPTVIYNQESPCIPNAITRLTKCTEI